VNYYGPRLRDGRWIYTCQNGDSVWPIGYCAEQNHHHATRDDACACYKDFILDHLDWREILVVKQYAKRRACRGCYTETDELAQIDHHPIPLCSKCRTREVVARVLHIDVAAAVY
jgi:hypothetical protein